AGPGRSRADPLSRGRARRRSRQHRAARRPHHAARQPARPAHVCGAARARPPAPRGAPLGVVRLTLSRALHRGGAATFTPGCGGISPLAYSAIAAPEPIAASRVRPDPPRSCPARAPVGADVGPGASLKPVRSLVKQERPDHLLTTGAPRARRGPTRGVWARAARLTRR